MTVPRHLRPYKAGDTVVYPASMSVRLWAKPFAKKIDQAEANRLNKLEGRIAEPEADA
ncbi:hypothetical protein J4573_52915 [Actinomadura barringtoniae]|uniref:Uncharacterized protein n=1 Tax=Actinomadura barringtoniae TaxID=1427535 RepID=A0A939PN48_9ACTN|nr:hypothetical protein [Actinomadura barringtoniae]MBO2455861.1 hypothetical protein [Actinomadura barringtoniae]